MIVKLSNSQLNKLKSGIKFGTEINLNLSSNLIGNSNNATDFLHKLLLIDIQDSGHRKPFANNSSAIIKLSITQISKVVQVGGIISLNPSEIMRATRGFLKSINEGI